MTDPPHTTPAPLSWERLREAAVSVPSHVACRRFASEMVLLNINTGIYYGMDEVGARFFEVLRETGSAKVAASQLAQEFQATEQRVQEDLRTYCADLLALGLIELTD